MHDPEPDVDGSWTMLSVCFPQYWLRPRHVIMVHIVSTSGQSSTAE